MSRLAATLVVVAVLLSGSRVEAAPGDLDPTFGTGGQVVGPLFASPANLLAVAAAIQPDGRIVIVGSATLDGWYAITTVRLLTDGSLDPSFGSGGVVTAPLGDGHDLARAVALQPDGRIIVAGDVDRSIDNSVEHGDMVVLRYLADGTLDASFGDGGVVRTSFGPNTDAADGVVVQPNGKIAVAGVTFVGTATAAHFALARYEADGSPDVTFGTAGKVVTVLRADDSLTSMALQPDGKLVVAGSSEFTTSAADAAIARYNPDGSLDAGFGGGGVFYTSLAPSITGFDAMTLQPDGKIVGAGLTHGDILIARLTSGGALDATFGTGGMLITDIDKAFLAAAVLVQPDGRTVAGGFRLKTSPATSYDFQLLRLDASGALDPGFGTGGSVVTNVGEGEFVASVQRQLDGKLVAVGWGYAGGTPQPMVVRYQGTPAACGNGVTEPPESCDDGNAAAGDGCDASCMVETGFSCAGMPSVCTAGCGDGAVGGSETCDDGNLVGGDGCDSTCRVELGWTCTGSPSSCVAICGDSRVVGGEECDDGNAHGGDCCDATCHFAAAGSPCPDDGDGCIANDVCAAGGVCRHIVDLDLCPICGDGAVTGDEECDDGNTASGDCCDASCHYGPVGSACADDGDLCSNDTCDAGGVCQHAVAPDPTCLVPIVPAKAQLKVIDKTNDQVKFTWTKGPAVSKATFGIPSTGTPQYALCLYDEVGGSPVSRLKAVASGDGDCTDQACWIESAKGWRLKNASGASDGIVALKLVAGAEAGKSKVQVKLKGSYLATPALPFAGDPSVVAQLRSSDGQCYGAVFSSPTRNDVQLYRAKSD